MSLLQPIAEAYNGFIYKDRYIIYKDGAGCYSASNSYETIIVSYETIEEVKEDLDLYF